MARHAVLLRGINVGSHNRIKMPALVEVLQGIGCTEVQTYVQSGNAVVSSTLRPPALEKAVHEALKGVGIDSVVMVRSGKELDAVVADDPWPGVDPKLHHVAFLSGKVAASDLPAADDIAPEQLHLGPARTLHVHYAKGVHQSKLGNRLSDKKLGVSATARNWTTVLALQDLLRT
jgi:uncharacterized protein (DUF1697 family)